MRGLGLVELNSTEQSRAQSESGVVIPGLVDHPHLRIEGKTSKALEGTVWLGCRRAEDTARSRRLPQTRAMLKKLTERRFE
jgi:hypothetical protein